MSTVADSRDFRGTSDRGLTGARARERNVPLGNVVELVPGRLYKVIGFDIGRANVAKPGIAEGLGRIVEEFRNSPDPRQSIIITGHASESQLPGRGSEAYERERAAAVKQYLVKQGISPSRIQTTISGRPPLPASAYSPEQKASARSATIEIIPSKETRGTENRYIDNSTYAMAEPWPRWPKWPRPQIPQLGPILRHLSDFAGKDSRKTRKGPDKDERGAPFFEAFNPLNEVGRVKSAAAGLLLLYFKEEFELAAGLEYGFKAVREYSKYIDERRAQGKGERDDKESRRRFMAAMLKVIKSQKDPPHPLAFLVNPATGEWRGRLPGNEHFIGVQAGHTLSRQAGGFAYALEDADHNQRWRADTVEKLGLPAYSSAIEIGRVPVDVWSVKRWVKDGLLDVSALMTARPTVGWIDF
jgi:OmpA family